MEQRLFVPGFAVRGSLYHPGLPDGWQALDPPSLGTTRGRFDVYRGWLLEELIQRAGKVTLAGHSMGAALAIAACADRPDLVERMILFSPAGLPLVKPLRDSFWLLVRRAFVGLYPAREVAAVAGEMIGSPRATYRLARDVHNLDLSHEMSRVSTARIPAVVVGCRSDTLTTPALCQSIAHKLDATYEQVDGAGHVWMLRDWTRFRAFLTY